MKRRIESFRFQSFSLKQKKVLNWWRPGSPYADWDGVIADGSIRSGKTIAFIIGFVLWSVASFNDQNFIVSGRSIGALKRNVVKPMLAILRALGIKYTYNRSENFLEFGGNSYYLFGANNEASQDVLQGLTAAGWLGDEVALHPQSFVEQAIGRCSVEGSKLWLNCNPESPQHYVYVDLICKAREKRLLRLKFSLDDNLTLSEKIKARYRRMFSGVWFKRYILGLWVAAEGAIYDMFDEALHVIDDLPDDVEIKRYWVFADYGTSNPTVFLLIGEGKDGCYYVIDEWRWDSKQRGRQKTDSEYAGAFYEWIESTQVWPEFISIDPSAASFIAELRKEALKRQLLKKRSVAVKTANNDVLDGIRRTGSLFFQSKLKILRRCKGLIKEIVGYVWDRKAQDRGEDVPTKRDDHGPDALRYFANYICATRPNLVTF